MLYNRLTYDIILLEWKPIKLYNQRWCADRVTRKSLLAFKSSLSSLQHECYVEILCDTVIQRIDMHNLLCISLLFPLFYCYFFVECLMQPLTLSIVYFLFSGNERINTKRSFYVGKTRARYEPEIWSDICQTIAKDRRWFSIKSRGKQKLSKFSGPSGRENKTEGMYSEIELIRKYMLII